SPPDITISAGRGKATILGIGIRTPVLAAALIFGWNQTETADLMCRPAAIPPPLVLGRDYGRGRFPAAARVFFVRPWCSAWGARSARRWKRRQNQRRASFAETRLFQPRVTDLGRDSPLRPLGLPFEKQHLTDHGRDGRGLERLGNQKGRLGTFAGEEALRIGG